MRAQPNVSAMSDVGRKEKLAAAKKKLKQFQKTGRTPSNSPAPTGRNQTPMTSDKNSANSIGKENHNNSANSARSAPPSDTRTFHSTSKAESYTEGPPLRTGHQSRSSSASHSTTNSTPSSASPNPSPRLTTESTERLQQLSRQVNGLISETSTYVTNNEPMSSNGSDLHDLENRNRELAALLEKHIKANEQLNNQLQETRSYNSKLQQSLESDKKGFEDKLKRELGSLKEQLQVHIQTIGILVAEKTELQSALNQHHKSSDQRTEEVEELSGRLKASRQRVADLERSFTSASANNQKHEAASKELSKEVDRLKLELYKLNKANEEFQQQTSELQGRLQKQTTESARLEDELLETRGKLEMTDLYVQQLQNGERPDAQSKLQIEKLLAEKGELQAKVDQYEEAFQRVNQEREQLARQYQEYVEQLQQQSRALQTQINTQIEEKDQLFHQKQGLETTLEQLQTQQQGTATQASDLHKAKAELSEQVDKMSQELAELRQKYEGQVTDNNQLSRLVVEKEERVMELEMAVSRLSDNQVDRDKLLDSMQSDKTALSRAIAQNKQLKNQLAELQNGFVKMSNDNMELMTALSSEQHVAKELATRLSQQEEELKDLREQLSHKEQRLQEMQRNMENLTHQIEGSDIETRVREFQEQTPLIETLQKELSSAQETINTLTNQNSELRTQMMQRSGSDVSFSEEGGASLAQLETLSASVRQLELERNQVLAQLQGEREARGEVEHAYKELQRELATQAPATLNGDVINKAQFEVLQHAMMQLESKYTRAMRDKADLTDKTEQLEHIIMQLQGETDTIGEYISLYQTQRSLLRDRQVEKEQYISQLAREREDMSEKLAQLQGLVMQLLGDRQVLYDYRGNGSIAAKTLTNHAPPSHPATLRNEISGKLDSTNLEDWPDYTSSDSDSSEVEPITAGQHGQSPHQTHTAAARGSHPQAERPHAGESPQWANPHDDQTAQRIMTLLTELGSSNLIDGGVSSLSGSGGRSFLHCIHCTGNLVVV